MKVRVAAVQPRSHIGDDEHRNGRDALRWLDRCAKLEADLVLFPEGYPGPINAKNHYDALGPLAERAAALGLHVVASRLEPASPGKFFVGLHLIGDRGQTIGIYRRSVPLGPYVYHDIPAWGFDYEASEGGLPVFETRLGKIGLLVCSEVFAPELARALAIQGADLILLPAGGTINELMPAWQTLIWARAIENLVYTATTQNLYGADEKGVAMIAGPEGVHAKSSRPGVIVADVDLDRLVYLRDEDEHVTIPKPYRTVPGVMRWRRPQLYLDVLAQAPREVPDRDDARR
jgi:predicted amidohydrolase